MSILESLGIHLNRKSSGDLFSRWPKSADGTPEEPVFLCHCQSVDMEDRLLINRLEAFDIPCLCQCPGSGDFSRVILGISGTGTDIYVPASMLEKANDLSAEVPETEGEDEQ